MSHNQVARQDFSAFISYSHEDEDFAVRMQNYVETYRLPKALRRVCPEVPASMRPLARDVDTTSSGEIQTELRHIMQRSRRLIVVCSTSSAQPNREGKRYVDWEVSSFLGDTPDSNKARVIPIVRRTPATETLEDCLPPCMKEESYRPIDAAEMGEERAFNAVCARLADIHPEALWQYHNREKRLRRRFIILALMFLFCLLGLSIYEQVVPHHDYYAAIGWQGGEGISALVPVGVPETQLSTLETMHRSCYFLFSYRGGKLIEVSHLNNGGAMQGEEEHGFYFPAAMRFTYGQGDEKDKITKITFITEVGQEEFSIIACDEKNEVRLSTTAGQGKEQALSTGILTGRYTGYVDKILQGKQRTMTFFRQARIDWNQEKHRIDILYLTEDGTPARPEQKGDIVGISLQLEPKTHMVTENTWLGNPLCYRSIRNTYGRADEGYPLTLRKFECMNDCPQHRDTAHTGLIVYEWGQNGCCTRRVKLDSTGHMQDDCAFGYQPSTKLREMTPKDAHGHDAGTTVLDYTNNGVIHHLRNEKGEDKAFILGIERVREVNRLDYGTQMVYYETSDGKPMCPEGEQFNCTLLKLNAYGTPQGQIMYHTSYSLLDFKENLKKVNNREGYCRAEVLYDDAGQMISIDLEDAEGHPVDLNKALPLPPELTVPFPTTGHGLFTAERNQ